MRPCTPMPSALSATGRQLQKSQKTQACPKASLNRSRHRYADPRRARRATAPERARRPFLLDRARPVFFSGKTEKKMGGALGQAGNPAEFRAQWDAPRGRQIAAPTASQG